MLDEGIANGIQNTCNVKQLHTQNMQFPKHENVEIKHKLKLTKNITYSTEIRMQFPN